MKPQNLSFSQNYVAVAKGLRELHRLTSLGQDETPEADAIRDTIDLPWAALTEVEEERARGLSADLYTISDSPKERPRRSTPPNPQVNAKLAEMKVARDHGEWDRALELLRRWDRYVPAALASFVRGAIWLEAGDPGTSALFYTHAAELEPQNGQFITMALHTLDHADPSEAQRQSLEILNRDGEFPAIAVIRAANVMFRTARSIPEADAATQYRGLIPILERTLARIEGGAWSEIDQPAYVLTCGLLGYTFEFLGDTESAIRNYSRGLLVDPNEGTLLGARGTLLYGVSSQAISDLRRAVELQCAAVWPYILLAHHELVGGRYAACLSLCSRAKRMPASDRAKGELAEWSAISQAWLGFPPETVIASFEEAVALDPKNDRITHNLLEFKKHLNSLQAISWETPREVAVRALGLAARRLARAA